MDKNDMDISMHMGGPSDKKYVSERFGRSPEAEKVLNKKEEYQKQLDSLLAKSDIWLLDYDRSIGQKAHEFSEKLVLEFGNDREKEGVKVGRCPFWAELYYPEPMSSD
ncbi:MAG: hypothetical protein JRN32_01755 [Nitrososphaerota archaeon]|nr:hypothetical protein [Nitrososphaerota archaeon]